MSKKDEFYNELVSALQSESLPSILGWMAANGESVALRYNKYDKLWECCWVRASEGVHIMANISLIDAVKSTLNSVRSEVLFNTD